MKELKQIMLSKLIYQFVTLKNRCLPKNLAFSDEYLNLNEEENKALEEVIGEMIKSGYLIRRSGQLCLSEKGLEWAEKESDLSNIISDDGIPPFELIRLIVSFYKLSKKNQEDVVRKIVKSANEYENLEDFIKTFGSILSNYNIISKKDE